MFDALNRPTDEAHGSPYATKEIERERARESASFQVHRKLQCGNQGDSMSNPYMDQ